MNTLLLPCSREEIQQLRTQESKYKTRRFCPPIERNDLIVFYTTEPVRKIEMYGFADKVRKPLRTHSEPFALGIKNLCELKHPLTFAEIIGEMPIDLERSLNEFPEFYLHLDFQKVGSRLGIENLHKYEPHYVYLAQEMKPENNELITGLIRHLPQYKLCFLAMTKSLSAIEDNLAYSSDSLELVATVALPNKKAAENYLRHLRKKYRAFNLERNWYELNLDQTEDILASFERVHEKHKIQLFYEL